MDLVDQLLEGVDDSAWDELVAFWERFGQRSLKDSGIDEFLTVIGNVYNGGFQQVVDNNHLGDVPAALQPVRAVAADDQADETARRKCIDLLEIFEDLRGPLNSYERAMRDIQREYDEDACTQASEELEGFADGPESWIYDDANMVPIFRAIMTHYTNIVTTPTAKFMRTLGATKPVDEAPPT